MPVYKYILKDGSERYYTKFYYKNWKGERKQDLKRGFIRQRDAKAYEINFLAKIATNPTVPFAILAEKYLENCICIKSFGSYAVSVWTQDDGVYH